MKTFKTHEEIINAWYDRIYDIYYENGNIRYEVRRIGSTIYCYDEKQDCGKGAVHNFDVSKFYAIDKPIKTEESTENNNIC